VVRPVVTYVSGTRVLKESEKKLLVFGRKILRKIFGLGKKTIAGE
jgi:hypothetical protein